jgi:colanic acid/amylovoran biosynthesis glycosyltransferase
MHIIVVGLQTQTEPFIQRKLDGLRAAGVRVSVAWRSDWRRRRAMVGGCPVIAPAHIADSGADVVHFEWNSAAIDALPDAGIWSLPTVISSRGTQIRIRPHVTEGYAGKLRETFRRATAVHCVCETIRDEAVALGLDSQKAELIYPAVDTNEFTIQSRASSDGTLRLLAVGGLIWTKGYEYALLTMRALLDRGIDARLEIIGNGNERQRVLFTANDLGLTDRVSLRLSVPPAQVREAMQRSDIFLHSSLSEGISNAALEAMACGLPVVTSDCGGMKEAVRHGQEGFVVPLRDPAAAADAVATLARDPEFGARMGRAGRATVESKFRLDDQIARFIALYERVAATHVSA